MIKHRVTHIKLLDPLMKTCPFLFYLITLLSHSRVNEAPSPHSQHATEQINTNNV